ncbi:MAG TPA: NAD(P)-dependent oxidoreductase [Acidobacteriota bacterium]|nr:NAD(P)-dependent oxidoreductase [Acidobacteriota bacterium]
MTGRLPSIVITGASGFVGRHLLDDLKSEYRIFAIARRSQHECNAPVHANIAWIRADIADFAGIARAFREIATAGGADYLIHLAAYYDFTGKKRPEYRRTNVEGTRYILDLAASLNLKLFVFASSVAACSFPKKDEVVNEASPPDGKLLYPWSKRQGEAMVREFGRTTPSCIVRLGAVFSDWCEYPPLYAFLTTWLGGSWRAGILAGHGESAIPYIHVRDVVAFFRNLLARHAHLGPAEVLIVSTPGSTTHRELFSLALRYFYGRIRKPMLMPAFLCGIGIRLRLLWGYITKNEPFERPWMQRYIDRQLNIENSRTSSLLQWAADPRHLIERRFPFLMERLKSEPLEWRLRNLAAMRRETDHPNLRIYTALTSLEDDIIQAVIEQITGPADATRYPAIRSLDRTELTWFLKLIYRLLLTSVHTGNKMLLLDYFEISGLRRIEAGYPAEETARMLAELNRTTIERLRRVEDLRPFVNQIYDFVSMPLEFGIDEIEQQHQLRLHELRGERGPSEAPAAIEPARSAREQLEETIWSCLVKRK